MVRICKFSRSVAALLKAREVVNKPLGFPGDATVMTDDHLAKFNIKPDGRLGIQLCLKPGHAERAAVTSTLGKERFWSSANFHSHLEVLQSLVTVESAHTWIDPFFFRVSAMLPSNQSMVLSVEQVIQQTTKHPSRGYIDYTAVIANNHQAKHVLTSLSSSDLSILMPSGFFVAVPKIESAILLEHVPQAVREMYACAKKLKRGTLRGALSNGHSWVFIIVVVNPEGNGAKYRYSLPIQVQSGAPYLQIAKPWPDVLAGILLHWIKNSFADIGKDDWFENCENM